MRCLPLLTFASLLMILPGCPEPGGLMVDDDDVADDDDVTDDDDDTTDDDDDTTDDDDDDTGPGECAEIGDGGVYFDAWGADPNGTYLDGLMGWDGEHLSVEPDFGPAFAQQIYYTPGNPDLDAMLDCVDGQKGRFYLQSFASGAWSRYGVLAVTTKNCMVILGQSEFPAAAQEFLGFYLEVSPQEGACPDGVIEIDSCGMGSALPLEVTAPGEESASVLVWPGEDAQIAGFTFEHYRGYQMHENWCDDFDDVGMSWSMVKK